MKYYLYLVLWVCCTLTSCSVTINGNFTNKPFKSPPDANGISASYYAISPDTKILDLIFFYSNYQVRRLTMDHNHYNFNDLSKSIDSIVNNLDYLNLEEGGYRIENDKLTIQDIRYITQLYYEVVNYEAVLLSNSSFRMNNFTFLKKGIRKELDLVYNKIDVVKPEPNKKNRWINKSWYWQN